MINSIIELSLKYRVIVLVAGVVLVISGAHALVHLPLDAFPDTTPVQVQVHATAPALGPEEIEQQITLPIEWAMSGLPGLEEIRSVSKYGFSLVTVQFDDSVSIDFARQKVHERLAEVDLPAGLKHPRMAPLSSGLGEIYNYMLERPVMEGATPEENLRELRTIQDWVIKPMLRPVPGIAEINSWGGFEKQFHVEVDPARIAKYELTLDQVTELLAKNNLNVGGGSLDRAGEAELVQGRGIVSTVQEIGDIVLASFSGVPIRLRDVAEVKIGHQIRRGAVTTEGRGETVL